MTFHPTMHERLLVRTGRVNAAVRAVAKRQGIEKRAALGLVRSTREYRMPEAKAARVRTMLRMIDFVGSD